MLSVRSAATAEDCKHMSGFLCSERKKADFSDDRDPCAARTQCVWALNASPDSPPRKSQGQQPLTCVNSCVPSAEFLFLLWGVYLCYAVRTVPSAFHEPRYMAVAIYNELLISAIFHIIR